MSRFFSDLDKDHPRVCGEKLTIHPVHPRNSGSPPRVRGEVKESPLEHRKRRITPACAGRRTLVGGSCPIARDHPRVCGEKSKSARMMNRTRGSPPRVRGEAHHPRHAVKCRRITPACAGRSQPLPAARLHHGDHPRVCGEKFAFPDLAQTIEGSPPRVRGEAYGHLMACQALRITPACAGRSCSAATGRDAGWDHPRVCGEKGLEVAVRLAVEGSPPRVRGEASMQFKPVSVIRITPACAGRRWRSQKSLCLTGDHPRVCGEKAAHPFIF